MHTYALKHITEAHAHPNLNEVGVSMIYMDETLNSDLVKIEKSGRSNKVEFNARKTQSCLLSHKRISDPGQNVCVGGMQIVKSETIDVLGTSFVGMIMFSMCQKKQPKV